MGSGGVPNRGVEKSYARKLERTYKQNTRVDRYKNGKKVLIVKDSYGNSMIPFIAKDYEYTYVIDPRLYRLDVSDYVKENEIEEVLLVYNVKTVETDLGIRNLR